MEIFEKIILDKQSEMKARDEMASEYDSQISDYKHVIEIVSCVRKLNPKKGELIFDAGCGTGRII